MGGIDPPRDNGEVVAGFACHRLTLCNMTAQGNALSINRPMLKP